MSKQTFRKNINSRITKMKAFLPAGEGAQTSVVSSLESGSGSGLIPIVVQNKVALIQSELFFTPELKEKYLGCIKLITSINILEIYKFIERNVRENCIYKYILHVNSGVLNNFIDYIYDKKNTSACSRELLSECIFVATLSNADNVRQKNIEKKTNILFNLSPISKLLSVLNDLASGFLMLVVSDASTPYYDQIYNTTILPKYRISELTVDKLKAFNGRTINIALNTIEEYNKMTQLILDSNYNKGLNYIELKFKEPLIPLLYKVSSITTNSSGQGISGNIKEYIELNQYQLYDIGATVLANSYKFWNELIKNKVIAESPDYNVSVLYDLRPSIKVNRV